VVLCVTSVSLRAAACCAATFFSTRWLLNAPSYSSWTTTADTSISRGAYLRMRLAIGKVVSLSSAMTGFAQRFLVGV
jgi:hypothetical protein